MAAAISGEIAVAVMEHPTRICVAVHVRSAKIRQISR